MTAGQAVLPRPPPRHAAMMGIPACLSDPAITGLKFELDQCPSLLRLLDAVQLGNQNPAVSCDLGCVRQFAKLNDTCAKEMRDAFSAGTTDNVGPLATAFFESCDELVQGNTAGPSPSMAPGPAPALAPSPAVAPSPELAETAAPAPSPVAAPPQNGAAASLPSALLTLVAAAAYMLL
ncbi:hypothetical protein ABPG75_008076 [Micractinium tetrahymenae]